MKIKFVGYMTIHATLSQKGTEMAVETLSPMIKDIFDLPHNTQITTLSDGKHTYFGEFDKEN